MEVRDIRAALAGVGKVKSTHKAHVEGSHTTLYYHYPWTGHEDMLNIRADAVCALQKLDESNLIWVTIKVRHAKMNNGLYTREAVLYVRWFERTSDANRMIIDHMRPCKGWVNVRRG